MISFAEFNVPTLYILANQVLFRSYVLRHIRLRPRLRSRGGGPAIYGLYRYVPLGRVWFSSSLL